MVERRSKYSPSALARQASRVAPEVPQNDMFAGAKPLPTARSVSPVLSYKALLEAYGKHYTVAFPHEEYASGRPRIVSPLYDRLKASGAVFGSKLGWERPNWFAPSGTERGDIYSMGRQNWFDAVGEEHAHVRAHAGVFDQSSFAKYEMTGKDATAALEWICANRISKPVGSV